MKIIVGLGNPGSKYFWTRHNLGFMLIDALSEESSFQNKYQSHIQKINRENEKLLLVKPQTFMNLSGQAVKEIINFYKAPLEDLLVIQDDKDIPFGKMKFQKARGHGGHNGIKNIHQELNSNSYTRLKMGIGAEAASSESDSTEAAFSKNDPVKTAVQSKSLPSSKEEKKHSLQNDDSITGQSILKDPSEKLNKITIDYVLSPFNKKEKEKLPGFLKKGVEAVSCFIQKGYEASANQFNSY